MATESVDTTSMSIIEIITLLIGVVVVYIAFVNVVGILGEERGAEGSATNVTNAINDVYECLKEAEEGPGDPSQCNSDAVVTLHQPDPTEPTPNDDIRWIVYWKRTVEDKADETRTLDNENAQGSQNYAGIDTIWDENSRRGGTPVWCGPNEKSSDPPNSRGICYGSALRGEQIEQKPLTPVVDENDYDTVHNFWLISPCYAKMEFYWDDSADKIKLRFTENMMGDREYNYCCDDGDSFGSTSEGGSGTDWPGDDHDGGEAFGYGIDSRGEEHPDAGQPENLCDFQ